MAERLASVLSAMPSRDGFYRFLWALPGLPVSDRLDMPGQDRRCQIRLPGSEGIENGAVIAIRRRVPFGSPTGE